MKTINITLMLLSIHFMALGQEADTIKQKVTNIEIGPIKIKINEDGKETKEINTESIKIDASSDKVEKKKSVSFNLGLDYGMAGYVTMLVKDPTIYLLQNDLSLDYARSRNLAFNGLVSFNFHKNIGLVTGLRYSKMMFRYKNIFSIDPTGGYIVSYDNILPYVVTVDKAENYFQFNVHYLQVPLLLKLQSNSSDFKIALGVLGGLKVKNLIIHEYEYENVEGKQKIKNIIEAKDFDLALTGRITYKNIGFFGTASLTDLYENQVKNGRSMPFSAGLTLGGF